MNNKDHRLCIQLLALSITQLHAGQVFLENNELAA